jgi:hypothetical protein
MKIDKVNRITLGLTGLLLSISVLLILGIHGCGKSDDDNDVGSSGTPSMADAGNDQTVPIASDVTLDGSASHDPDGHPITYTWSQTAGPTVTLTGTANITATFSPGEVTVYTFMLSVSNGSLTDTDTVNITAQGIQSGNFYIDIYKKDKVISGTTLFYDTLEVRLKPAIIAWWN